MFVLLVGACVGGFYAFLTHLPVVRVEIGQGKVDPPVQAAAVGIPEAILEYINQESEQHARDTRKQYARSLFAESRNWDVVLRQLQREDNPE